MSLQNQLLDSFGHARARAFVGKTTWVKEEDLGDEDKIGSVHKVWDANYYYGENASADRQYWNVIKNVSTEVHNLPSNKLDFLNYIFVTNLVKCNIDDKRKKSSNVTPKVYFRNCMDIFEKEIMIVKPSHVILFTGVNYDDLIDTLTFGYNKKHIYDVTDDEYKKTINDKNVWWWHRIYEDKASKLQLLRTRHPQGATSGFTCELVNWITRAHADT